jgi:DNA-directed RNA polymerase subunit D
MDRKVEIVTLTRNTITLYLEGYRRSLVNAIRRIALSDVPTMAVDFAYFYDNLTSVPAEIIAHRLGLVVLDSNTAIRKYRSPEECREADEKDSSCYVEIFIQKSVPEDASKGEYVKASDMVMSDPQVKPVYSETPIVYLAPGQRVHIVAYARLGRGREHAKWMPATVSILQYLPVVEFDGEKASEECIECLQAYKDLVNALKEKKKGKIEYKRNINTSALRYCVETPGICNGAVKLSYDESRLLLTIESTGALKPELIVLEAINALEARVRRVLESAKAVGVVIGSE